MEMYRAGMLLVGVVIMLAWMEAEEPVVVIMLVGMI